MNRKILLEIILLFCVLGITNASAVSDDDAQIAQVEKQVAILRSEVRELKTLQKQALLKN